MRKDDKCVYQKVLSAADVICRNGQLSAWDFGFPSTNLFYRLFLNFLVTISIYRGLYPRSWTCYNVPELGILVTIRQISPVIPDDYEVCSL